MPIQTSAVAMPWEVEVPCPAPDDPAILYREGELWVAYANDEGNCLHTVIRFRRVIEHSLSSRVLHNLLRRNPGLAPAADAVNEIFGSDAVAQHTTTVAAGGVISQARHWVLTFHDTSLEVVAQGDTDPVTARRPGHCLAGHLASLISASIPAASPVGAIFAAFMDHADRQPHAGVNYGNGVVAKVGDRVDDNGQGALVEEVITTSSEAARVGANELGLCLRWDIGLPVFRPISSALWDGIRPVASDLNVGKMQTEQPDGGQ